MNRSYPIRISSSLRRLISSRGSVFGAILLLALLAFEVFNYSTTQFALTDMLGDLKTAGLRWAVVLALAFCGIDFAGIARLFTPQQGRDEPAEVWYLFGAWLLAAAFNAALTWWGVSVAIVNHQALGGALVGQAVLVRIVPVMVAVMVLMTRVLIIGSFSLAGENLFSSAEQRPVQRPAAYRPVPPVQPLQPRAPAADANAAYARPAAKPASRQMPRPEPTYHPVGMNADAYDEDRPVRR